MQIDDDQADDGGGGGGEDGEKVKSSIDFDSM
jgi:hypothetical protein